MATGKQVTPAWAQDKPRTPVELENDAAVRGMKEGSGTLGGFALGNKSQPTLVGEGNTLQPGENPFTKKAPEPVVVQEEVIIAPDGTPMWGDFVKFVMKHGDHIQRVEYPNPPKNTDMEEFFRGKPVPAGGRPVNVIDTQWKGIPVFQGGAARIMHDVYGWATWEDCQT